MVRGEVLHGVSRIVGESFSPERPSTCGLADDAAQYADDVLGRAGEVEHRLDGGDGDVGIPKLV